jgi:2-keto-4-pentenoate hydratase
VPGFRCWQAGVTLCEALRLTAPEHRRLADVLRSAARDRRAVEPLSRRRPWLTIADAARVRDMVLADRLWEGERLVGAKVTGGMPDPQLAWLTDSMLLDDSATDVGSLIRPRVEPRLALRMARPVRGPLDDAAVLLAEAGPLLPALEIVDSRYGRDDVDRADHVADNGGAAALVLGTGASPGAELEPLRVWIDRDGAGRTTLAPPPLAPLDALLWLANQLTRGGTELPRGMMLVCPAATGGSRLGPDDTVSAVIEPLGHVRVRSTGDSRRDARLRR